MAIRQYIGARYVPKFYEFNNGVWESNTEYEPLTIVTYNGNSYTSKKHVPANIGNPSDNSSYWASTGNYNAQVELYRQEVATLSEDVEDLSSRTKRNIIIIGDSYGTTNGAGITVTPYTQLLPTYLGLDNSNYKYACENGAGFGNGKFIDLLNSISDSTDVNEIFIFGGWNDVSSRYSHNDVVAKMIEFSNRARQKFPNAKLYLGVLAYGYKIGTTELSELSELAQFTYEQCSRWSSITYLNTTGVCANSTTEFWVDVTTTQGRFHPSDVGAIYIAHRLADIIVNKSPSFIETRNAISSPISPVTSGSAFLTQVNNGGIISTTSLNDEIIVHSTTGIDIPESWGTNIAYLFDFNNILTVGVDYHTKFIGVMRYKTLTQQSDWLETPVEIIFTQSKLGLRTLGDAITGLTEAYIRGVIGGYTGDVFSS